MKRVICCVLAVAAIVSGVMAAEADIYDRSNLVAWCIVPYDAKKRSPEERAAMLERIGLHKLAYDWRAEHVPTFDAEIEAMQRHHIEIVAWWFPAKLDDNAKKILDAIARHQIHPQLWVTMNDPARSATSDAQRVDAAVQTLKPIVEAAAKLGCKVSCYTHGGWFGEPEHQLAIIDAFKQLNLAGAPLPGMVYNFHHGHEQMDRFAEFWPKIKDHVDAVTLNGMRLGEKITVVGAGDREGELMQIIRDSGWRGMVNVLCHRNDVDAEEQLKANMAGVEAIRTGQWKPAQRPRTTSPASLKPAARTLPIEVTVVGSTGSPDVLHVLLASEPKSSPTHWELFTAKKTGELTLFMPGYTPEHVRSGVGITDGQPHTIEFRFDGKKVVLRVDGHDGKPTAVAAKNPGMVYGPGEVRIGALLDGALPCGGAITSVVIRSGGGEEKWTGSVAPPPASEKPTPSGPTGLVRITDGKSYDVVRTASLSAEETGSAVWRGQINVAARDRYTLAVQGKRDVNLTINGKPVTLGQRITLNKGPNAFEMTASASAVPMRLMWSTADFPAEPVPATAFTHTGDSPDVSAGLRITEGRRLFAELRCVRCHAPSNDLASPSSMPELTQLDAPMLLDAGLRLNENWVARWVENPHALRSTATMPALVKAGEGKHVAAFLATLHFGQLEAATIPNGDQAVRAGGELFATLGCVGCHSLSNSSDRLGLQHLASKFKPAALYDYLRNPAKRYAWSRMPDFKLSEAEAAQLTAFLLKQSTAAPETSVGGDAERGKQIVQAAGCVACHPMTVGNDLKAPAISAIVDWSRGCIGDEKSRGRAPDFSLTPEQRESLAAFGRGSISSVAHDTAADFARRQMQRLNCNACHEIDGVKDQWTQHAGEVAKLLPQPEKDKEANADGKKKRKADAEEPLVDQSRPSLTYAGDKLHGDYMRKLIAGELPYKTRPWLTARMPSFGVYAAKLAAGLASGVEQPAEPAPSPEMVEAGRVLVTKQKGFGCTDCHALGDQPAQAVFEAEGVNLAFTRERLRLDYFRTWMHDPTRLDPATKMPRFADEHGMTLISELLDGNGERQFEAIRQYLATLTPPKQNIAGQRGNAPADYTHMTDANWLDNRFQKMVERERVMSTTVKLPGEKAAYKGVVMRVGDHDEATVCFDTATLKMRAAWTGGFLDVGPRRFSLTEIPTPHGQMLWVTPANTPGWTHDGSFADPRKTEYEVLPHDHGVFEGYYIHDQRVVLKYRVGGVEVLESPWAEKRGEKLVITRDLVIAPSKDVMQLSMPSKVTVAAQVRGGGVSTSTDEKGNVSIGIEPHDEPVAIKLVIGGGFSPTAVAPLKTWTTGGTSRLGEPLTTRGVVGRSNGPFEVDTVTVPYENPFDALFFTAGHDFFDDGRAAVCTAHGDVWLVSGIDGSLDQVKWKRFATGLFQPLGLKIVDGKVFVICRDSLVRLHDLNGDGEADYYERFNNDLQVTTSGHSFATCLETDTDGNFYFVKCGDPGAHAGCVLKVSRDGSKLEIVATGLRNPNGMGMGPGNLLTEADNQGNWVPESRVDIIKPGGFYGFVPNSHRSEEPKSYDGPLCWVPRVLDNSSGGQVWVPTGSWGPLGGQMLHLSYGRARMMMILRDYVDGVDQGATVSLPGRFLSGAMRGRFNPRDGHLYVSGLNGWQTAAVRDGCFQRVRYTGKPLYLPIAWAVKHDAIELTFTQKLDKATAEDAANYAAEQWNYLWSKGYGSKDWSPSNPSAEGRDPVTIKSAKLLEDGKTVRLEMPGLTPVMQMRISYNVDAADGAVVKGELYPTINRVPAH